MANFCVHFSKNFRYLDKVDQVIIPYRRSKNVIAELCKKQKFIVTINITPESEKEQKDLKLWQNLYKKYQTLKVRIPFKERLIWEKLGEMGVPFFFSDPIGDYTVLEGICALPHPPQEIFVSGFLAYDIIRVSEYAHAHNIKIRMIPNVAQSEWSVYSIKSFFITPEAIPIYEKYVDTFELFSDNIIKNNNVVFEIYALDKEFYGPIKTLIAGLDIPGDSQKLQGLLLPKLECKYRCLLNKDCKVCDSIQQYLKTAKE